MVAVPIYEITVKSEFSSAHRLRHYKGKCEDLHGHNWRIEASFLSKKLDKRGMVLDFKIAKRKLNAVLEELDHRYLNDLSYFKKNNPTSENIARYIYDKLSSKSKFRNLRVTKITVYETETSAATYYGE